MLDYIETCSSCGATGQGMQDWCPPEYPAVGEMCEPCFKRRYPERHARATEPEADQGACEYCGRSV